MEQTTNIINTIISNFDFTLMLLINIATFIIIKLIDDANGKKKVNVWIKRLVFLFVSIAIGLTYYKYNNTDVIIIINSCIIAPISWSWIFKPIAKKIGLDYKQLNN